MRQDSKIKLHKDYYEYKTIPFTYFKRVANRHDFKRQWVTVKCQEDIMKQKPNIVEIRRLKKNVRQYDICLLYTSPSPRDGLLARMPSSA